MLNFPNHVGGIKASEDALQFRSKLQCSNGSTMLPVESQSSSESSDSEPCTPFNQDIPDTPKYDQRYENAMRRASVEIRDQMQMQRRWSTGIVVAPAVIPVYVQPFQPLSQIQCQPANYAVGMMDQGIEDCEPHLPSPMALESSNEPAQSEQPDSPPLTTVLVKNIPSKYTQRLLYTQMKLQGFEHCIDLLYAPVNMSTKGCLGYAFINFVDPKFAYEFIEVFHNTKPPHFKGKKVLECEFAKVQGLEGNLHKLRSSLVWSANIPPEYQPLMFDRETGQEIPFMTEENLCTMQVQSRRKTWSLKSIMLPTGDDSEPSKYVEMVRAVREKSERHFHKCHQFYQTNSLWQN